MSKNITLFGLSAERMAYAPEPAAVILSPEKIAQWFGVDTDIGMARQAAARNIRAARQRHRRLAMAKELRFATHLDERREQLENDHVRQRQMQINNTIRWMIDERELEQHLYDAAMQKARDWAIEILKAWGEEANFETGLLKRVKAMHSLLHKESELTLTVPPGEVAQMLAAQQQTAPPLYHVAIDNLMPPSQARLGNTLVQVTIDMHQELDNVLMQLRNQPVHTVSCKENE